MLIRKTALGLIMAGLCSPLLASGRIDYSSLNDATLGSAPRFIIKYRSGATERVNVSARQKSLDAASVRAQPKVQMLTNAAGKRIGLKVSTVRATARGMHLVRASQRMSKAEAQALMQSLAKDPNIEYVAVDGRMHADALPNDPVMASHQAWHYGTGAGGARVTEAWNQSLGDGVVVAVLDTGATHHADLEPNLLSGYDFISDAFVSRRADDSRVAGGWDLGDWNTAGECGPTSGPRDSTWHGSHVSGTIAEVTNNGIGGAGVAPNARVVPVRVLGRCGGYDADVADAIIWASGGTVEGVPANPNPAEVINMSLGSSRTCPQVMQDAINVAVSRGTTVVVAAGNSNVDASQHAPASCANVVTVGATGYSGQRASYSNYGTVVDIAAPGGAGSEGVPNGFIWSTVNQSTTSPGVDGYGGMTGTSMATPHVAGIAALMQAVAPQPLTPSEVEGLLKATARAFPVKPDRALGTGIVDAASAVQQAITFGQPIEASPLTSGVANQVPPLAVGENQMFAIIVPEGATRLELLTYGGRGVVTMHAQYEAEPLPASNVGKSTRPGTNQSIVLTAPAAGTYYVKVTATAATAGVSIRATVR